MADLFYLILRIFMNQWSVRRRIREPTDTLQGEMDRSEVDYLSKNRTRVVQHDTTRHSTTQPTQARGDTLTNWLSHELAPFKYAIMPTQKLKKHFSRFTDLFIFPRKWTSQGVKSEPFAMFNRLGLLHVLAPFRKGALKLCATPN